MLPPRTQQGLPASGGPSALREGAAGASQGLALTSFPPIKQPVGLQQEEVRLRAPMATSPRQAGPLGVFQMRLTPQHTHGISHCGQDGRDEVSDHSVLPQAKEA